MSLLRMVPMLAFLGCASCAADLEVPEEPSPITWTECSQEIEDHPCDFTLKDQRGDDWTLYDHYGDVILLDFSTEWCGYCNLSAESIQGTADAYESHGIQVVTVLLEDRYGNPGSVELAAAWAEYYGIDAPVLAGSRDMISDEPTLGWPIDGFPRYYFINREMVLWHGQAGYNDDSLEAVLRAMLNIEG